MNLTSIFKKNNLNLKILLNFKSISFLIISYFVFYFIILNFTEDIYFYSIGMTGKRKKFED